MKGASTLSSPGKSAEALPSLSQEASLPSPLRRFDMKLLTILLAASVGLTWVVLAAASASASASKVDHATSVISAYTAPSAFPTSAFSSYYDYPTGMKGEPRPVITEYNSGRPFASSVDQPYPLPTGPPSSDAVYPDPTVEITPVNITSQIKSEIVNLINNDTISSCQKCIRSLQAGQRLAHAEPKSVPNVLIDLCTDYNFTSTSSGLSQAEVCKRTYSGSVRGSQYAQILSYANLKGQSPSDGMYICNLVVGTQSNCTLPAPVDLNADGYLEKWFGGKERREERQRMETSGRSKKTGPPLLDARGKKRMMKVLHFSDVHVDPRFFVNGEAHCTSGQCCRSDSFNSTRASGPPMPPGSILLSGNISQAAAYWGNYKCDSPFSLLLSALQSVTHLNGGQTVDMSLFTGDSVVHDSNWHLSNDLVRYTQQAFFDLAKKYLGSGPVFSAVGNHDTAPSDSSSPHSLPDAGPRNEFSYDWANLQRLFEAEGWFTHDEAEQVSRHYGGYSVSPRKGLRIITINTDFWYLSNVYNYINSTDPDQSGTLRFLTDELEAAHKNRERVYIVGHVLSGWDGSNVLDNPTNLFYQIVNHYSPHTIAHIFFGHTHEDFFNVFYSSNGTERSTKYAKAVSFMGPSITPGSNVNSALRFYHIDPETYEVQDYDQYYTQVNDFADLPAAGHGPIWRHLYSAREEYSNFSSAYPNRTLDNNIRLDLGSIWPSTFPLNATFWSALTDEMLARPDLVKTFSINQARNSTTANYCTSGGCLQAVPCYARSGSGILGKECPQGFGSVQS
ncbi:hypothetical protein CBS101457_001673 [Exobasidium rhododendri]|nr:hypothetical protein CBS101457_001673 [Exobasidium rhododendri]